jgi:hypothetical protein
MNQRKYMILIKAEKLIQLTSSEHLSGFHSSKIEFLLLSISTFTRIPRSTFPYMPTPKADDFAS